MRREQEAKDETSTEKGKVFVIIVPSLLFFVLTAVMSRFRKSGTAMSGDKEENEACLRQ